jgi:hypothetical protein
MKLVRTQIWDNVEPHDSILKSVSYDVWGYAELRIWDRIFDQVLDQIWGHIRDQISDQIREVPNEIS